MAVMFPKHGAVYAKKLASDLLDQGYSEHQVFQGTGLTPALLRPEKPMVEFNLIAAFFEYAAQLTGNDALGFMRGQKRDLRRAGLIAYVGVSAPTVMGFIQNLSRYRRVFSDAIEVDCEALESDGALKWHFNVPAKIKRNQFVEFGASGLLHDIRRVANRRIVPNLVTFRHGRSSNTGEFSRYFGCEVQFGTKENAIYLRPADLALPLTTADDELYKVVRDCCENALKLKSRNAPALIVEVEGAISDRLSKGEASQDDVAKALGMSPRTLSRRLASQGTTFFKILEELRLALAMTYLRESGLVLSEIAFLLGYSGLSSFNDAFKRWTGTTPGQYCSA